MTGLPNPMEEMKLSIIHVLLVHEGLNREFHRFFHRVCLGVHKLMKKSLHYFELLFLKAFPMPFFYSDYDVLLYEYLLLFVDNRQGCK